MRLHSETLCVAYNYQSICLLFYYKTREMLLLDKQLMFWRRKRSVINWINVWLVSVAFILQVLFDYDCEQRLYPLLNANRRVAGIYKETEESCVSDIVWFVWEKYLPQQTTQFMLSRAIIRCVPLWHSYPRTVAADKMT